MRNTRGALSVDSTQSCITIGGIFRSVLIALSVAGALSACSSGDGGDGGNDPGTSGPGVGVDNPSNSGGLLFSYPVDGQTAVYADTQIVFAFPGAVNTDADSFAIVDDNGNALDGVQADNTGSGVVRLNLTAGAGQLAPNTRYQIQATDSIDADNTSFDAGDTLITFTTRPAPGAPGGDGDFSIAQNTRIGNLRVPFTQFDPIRATFSEPVDEGSIQLCSGMEAMGDNNCTVSVTDSDGTNVPGRLYALGNDFVFDPAQGNVPTDTNDANDYEDGDLRAGETYTVAFSDDVQSAYGNALASDSFQVTPVSIGRDVIQNLVVGDAGDGNSPVSGLTRNNVDLASQLIGSYDLAATAGPSGGLKVRLAAPGSSAYNNTFPTVIPAGQTFQLGALDLKLGSQADGDGGFTDGAVETPVNLDNLNIQFATDANAYLVGNDLRNIETPTRVTLALDLNITGNVPQGSPIEALSNGVVNQTALNIIASGIAVPQDNGDVSLITTGSFPIAVNRDGQASVDFELELTLPAAREDQPDIFADQTAPFITAQYPSACEHTFALDNFNGSATSALTPTSLSESSCSTLVANGTFVFPGVYDGYLVAASGFTNADGSAFTPLDEDQFMDALAATVPTSVQTPYATISATAKPSITLSEAVDPQSLAGNITLTQLQSSGNDGSDSNAVSVPITLHAEGSSVVINPVNGLLPGMSYELSIGQGVTDLAGIGLAGSYQTPVEFRTFPIVAGDEDIVRQNAPFVTSITPGLPCTLVDGDFESGGNVAGRCFGDLGTDANNPPFQGLPGSPKVVYNVFSHPANSPVEVLFDKEVQRDTVKLASACLIGGASDGNDTGASVAVQIMDGDTCEGIVPGTISYKGSRRDVSDHVLTNGFAFRPTRALQSGQRYWLVMCGSVDPNLSADNGQLPTPANKASACSSGATIIGRDGYALNTDPLFNTGTRQTNNPVDGSGLDPDRGAGGADLIMPFDGAAATSSYSTITLTSPNADTNGNGFFDAPPSPNPFTAPNPIERPGTVTSVNPDTDPATFTKIYDASLGQELPTPQNRLLSLSSLSFGGQVIPGTGDNIAYISGGVPITVEPASSASGCVAALGVESDGTRVVDSSAESGCVPVALAPGALLSLTNFVATGSLVTGRTLLRFPHELDNAGKDSEMPQHGYIVPSCNGTLNGEAFSYSPCFVADLQVTVNVLSVLAKPTTTANVPQQNIDLQLIGPVAFQQNGQLTISTVNTSAFVLSGMVFGSAPTVTQIQPGQQTLQLVGSAIHGGEAYLNR